MLKWFRNVLSGEIEVRDTSEADRIAYLRSRTYRSGGKNPHPRAREYEDVSDELGGSPGGGSQPVSVARVPLTSAEVLALTSAPGKLLVAGVAGKVIQPLSFAVTYLAGGTPYTDNGAFLGLYLDLAGNAYSLCSVGIPGAFLWDQATSQVGWTSPADLTSLGQAKANVAGKELSLFCLNAPEDGDGTLIVTVTYLLIDAA